MSEGANVFQDFGSLTDAFTAAAIDPSLWGAAMDAAADATGSFGANLVPLRGPRTPDEPFCRRLLPAADDMFREGWAARDGREQWVPDVMRHGVATAYLWKTPEEESRHLFFQEFLRPHGLRWFAGVKIGDGDDVWGLALHRTAEQAPYSPAEFKLLAELSPALAGTARLAAAFGFVRIDAMLSAFERSQSPVAMLARNGAVLKHNAAVERLLGDDLKIVGGRLVSWNPGATRALDGVLHQLLSKLGGVKPVVLPRKVGRPIIAYPSRLTNTPYDCFAPAQVLIVFADLEARRQVDMQPLMDAFGLCASEARVTSLLAGGTSIENAAESLGIAVSTARNQIKRVFEKTDTHSQGQLISLVSQLISPLTKS